MKKFIFTFCLLFALLMNLFSQNSYEEFIRQRQKEMTDFKNKADAEFTRYLEKRWAEFQEFRALEKPTKPKPKMAPIVSPEDIVNLPKIPDAPNLPEPPLPKPEEVIIHLPIYNPPEKMPENFEKITVNYFECPLYFQIDKKMRFSLTDNKEAAVAAAWEQLSTTEYSKLVTDCKSLVGENGTNDWAFYTLIDKIAESYFGTDFFNEKNLFKMFLLCQSGYKVKVARSGNSLFLLTASEQPIYGINYLIIENTNYYIFDANRKKSGDLYFTFPKDFSQSTHKLNLIITRPLKDVTKLSFEKYSAKGCDLTVTVCKNEALKAFYTTYPQCDVIVYAKSTPSETFSNMILPQFKKAVEGKSRQEAVGMILNFCQTAFEYKTDDEQFGFEKPFFPEELFYYPFCDCEDRSILFSYIVKNVLNMDVILLDYPQHIATAVHFQEHVSGNYVISNDKKYLICDPTYIGASVGMEMPEFSRKNIKPLPIVL